MVRLFCLVFVATAALAGSSLSALAASAGCDAVNAGGLSFAHGGGPFLQSRSVSQEFENGEEIDLVLTKTTQVVVRISLESSAGPSDENVNAANGSSLSIALAGGTQTVTAEIEGLFETGASVAATCAAAAAPTNTSLASSLNPSQVGDSVTFTAAVEPTGGAGTPTGNVVFTIDGTAQPAVALNGAGQAALTTSSLTAGTHTVTAAYGGDNNFLASTSAQLSQVVSGSGRTTATTIQSSLNPSQLGDAVTFTAAVAPATGTGTPTGNVIFAVDGVAQPAVALGATGIATLTATNLTIGTHTVSASYGGDATFAGSTSPVLNQVVERENQDSHDLREMQIMTTKIVAQTSGQSIQGAIDNAIDEGFSEGGTLITATDSSMRFNFAAQPKSAAENAEANAAAEPLDPLAFDERAAATGTDAKASKAIDASLGQQQTHAMSSTSGGDATGARWRPWVDVRYTDWNADDDQADVEGDQTNALVGVSYKINPKLLIGVFGGYENFDYSSVPLNATTDGEGWTAGAYLGWLFAPAIRFDVGIAHSWIDYSGTAGTAAGDFDGSRFLFTSSVIGTHPIGAFVVEPSAKIYVLWENDGAYTDSLGTLQPEYDFSTGRASGGLKVSYPLTLDDGMKFVPYAGVYGDYYFSEDDAAVALTFADVIEDGWSARFVGGFALTMPSGVNASLTGEVGGIGSGGAPHVAGRARLSVPF